MSNAQGGSSGSGQHQILGMTQSLGAALPQNPLAQSTISQTNLMRDSGINLHAPLISGSQLLRNEPMGDGGADPSLMVLGGEQDMNLTRG